MEWAKSELKTWKETMNSPSKDKWTQVIRNEIKSLNVKKTWSLTDKQLIELKWNLKSKE